MINYRIKEFNSPPIILKQGERLNNQIKAEVNMNGDLIRGNDYKPQQVVQLLKAYSIGKKDYDENRGDSAKCFYCESTSEAVASLQVEHYRPKAATHDANRREIPGSKGYYWLGLEWSNLVLACSKCNGRGAKGNIFTVQYKNILNGTSLNKARTKFNRKATIADIPPLINEKPDLLHPEIDNAYRYLKFLPTGEIKHKLERGKRTIEICKLDRRPLNIERSKLIKKFQDSFLEVVEYERTGLIKLNEDESFFLPKCKKLRENLSREKPYTLLTRYMIEDFENFFVSRIPTKFRIHLRNAFSKSK